MSSGQPESIISCLHDPPKRHWFHCTIEISHKTQKMNEQIKPFCHFGVPESQEVYKKSTSNVPPGRSLGSPLNGHRITAKWCNIFIRLEICPIKTNIALQQVNDRPVKCGIEICSAKGMAHDACLSHGVWYTSSLAELLIEAWIWQGQIMCRDALWPQYICWNWVGIESGKW